MATSNIESELASLQRIHERIQSARNEELASMLTLLLPRLIILTNQEALRIKAMAVLSECMKRIKLAALPIDTTKLLDLVRTQFLPFAPNLAITFVDITLEHSKAITDVQNAAAMLIAALPQFDAFTNASNSLCFYALLHFSIGIAKHFETQQSPVNLQEQSFQTILGDFALDICFLQRPQLAADVAAVGSVQPGLSVTRLDRLVTKKKSWSASDLKSIKLIMINLIASKVFLPHHAVLISVILSNDVDAEVSAQANFKMNGCVNILSIDTSVRTATEVCTAVLALCSSDEQVHKDTPVAHRRSTIKAEVRLSALRWLGRHLPAQLGPSAKAILMLVFRAVFNPAAQASGVSVASSLTEEVAVVGAALQLLDLVLPQVVDDQQFTGMVLLVSLCVKKILQSFAYSASSFSAGEHHTTVRSCCYRIAETIALRYVERSKQLAARSVEELALRNAVESSESVVEYISLDARAAAPASTPTPVGVVALSTSPGPTEATVAQLAKVTVEDADLLMLLFQLLDREHAQRNESSIVALYRAMNSLRDAFLLVQKSSVADGVAAAADSPRPVGLNLAMSSKLQELLRSVRRADKDVKMRLVALQWCRALFHWDPFVLETMHMLADDPNDAVSIAAVAEFVRLKALLCEPPIDSSTQKNGAILSFVLELIVSTVGVPPDSCGGGAPSSYLGLHLLLDTAACALFQHRSDDTSGAVRWSCLPLPLLEKALQAVASVDLVRSLSQGAGPLADKGHEVYFTSLRAASAAIVSSEPVVENVLQQEADRRAKRKELGKADALTTSAPLLRSVSSITRCILSSTLADAASGMDSSRTALLSVCKAYLPQYLTWLALPEHDVRRDVSQIIAQVCVGTFAGVGTASPPTADLNEISTLSRQLFHKLSCIPSMLAVSTTPATATAGTGSGSAPAGLSASGLSAAGALSVLGSIAVALLECAAVQVEGSSRAELRVEADRLVSQLLSQCIACLKLDPAISLEHCLVQVSALEGIIALSGCNFLSISEQARCAHWGEVKVNMKRLIHSTDFRCAVPAVEAFTNLCVAGASSVWEFWQELMKPELRQRESQCFKFAWAEAVVRLCVLPISTTDLFACESDPVDFAESVRKLAAKLHMEEAVAQATTVTPLLLHLLGGIELSAVKTSSEPTSVSERSTYCVALLVFIKKCSPGSTFPKPITKMLLELLLRFLKDKDLFIQDVCCMSLCHLYHTADRTTVSETAVMAGLAGQSVTVAEYIAQEVTVALTREKRAVQPAGYNVGATSAPSRNTAAATTAPAETGAVAGGGGGAPPPRDDAHLMQAAVAAAAELGVGLRFASGTEEINASPTEQLPQDYVVYSAICKLAKVAKDQSILFAVLALIKRDPTFGTGPSMSLQVTYAPPAVHFPTSKLVEMLPMLYHARFDPHTTVRPVMRALWDALMDKHFPQQHHLQLDLIQRRVVNFLCQKLQSAQWRDREAACLALEAFLPRRSWEVSVFPLLEELFNSAMRVLDDMRDSTRGAAISFTKALSSHIVRACNPDEVSDSTVTCTLDKILPLLLEKGLVAPSAEARGVSLGLLGKVVEAAKSAVALRKWLAQIISVLVEGMSALEPQTLQYMQFHTARLRISEEELEAMRIKMAQSSPLQEALEICLNCLHNATFYDTTTSLIPDVMQGLCAQLQRGVGLATRAAAAQALSQMAERYPLYLGKGTSGARSASIAFQSIIWSLTQAPLMAVTLKKAMTSAFGALSKVVDEEVLASECAALVTRYCSLEPGQLDQSLVLAQCIQQIVQRGGQRMEDGAAENRTAMWDRLLSCAYLGSHDSDAESRAVWTATWLEALSTSGAGTKLGAVLRTLPLLLEMVKTMYLERSWHRRVQAVQVFREVIDILPGDTLEAEFAKAEVSRRVTDLLRTLLLSIPGQVWSGQAVVLDVISELVAKYKAHVIFSSVMADTSAATVEVLSAGDDLESSLTLEKLTNANLCRHILNDLADAADPRAAAAAASVRTLKWELSFFGWALLLVHESRRGARNNSNLAEAEYRLAAARAVSLLPWPALCATPEGVVTFGRLLPVLCKQSNIPPYVRVVLPDASNSGAAVRDGTDSAGQGQGQAKRGNKRTLGSAALFGVRYSMKDSGNPSRSRPDQNTATREISEAPTVTLHDNEEGQEEEGMVMAAEEAQGEPEGAVDSHEHEQRVQVQVVGSNSTVESMDVENSTCDKLNSAADCDVAVTTVEDVILSETAVQQEEFVHKHPPAYHVFYIDSLLRCWPRDECTFPVLESQLADCAQHILVWAEAAMRTEVWSLRKAAAQLVGAAASSRPLSPAQCASALLVIELAISEQKFVKVRVEALKCLALVLQSVNRAHINSSEELKTRVRELIRNASTDSQPTILEAVAKVQNVWLR